MFFNSCNVIGRQILGGWGGKKVPGFAEFLYELVVAEVSAAG